MRQTTESERVIGPVDDDWEQTPASGTELTAVPQDATNKPKQRKVRIKRDPNDIVAIKVTILESTRRKLASRAAADGHLIPEATQEALERGLAPTAPTPTTEEILVRVLPMIDRGLFDRLDKARQSQRKSWSQFAYQMMTLLAREVAPVAPPRPEHRPIGNGRGFLDLAVTDATGGSGGVHTAANR